MILAVDAYLYHSFAAAVWNPAVGVGHYTQFRRALKTHLFVHYSCSAEWQCFSCAVYKFAHLLIVVVDGGLELF